MWRNPLSVWRVVVLLGTSLGIAQSSFGETGNVLVVEKTASTSNVERSAPASPSPLQSSGLNAGGGVTLVGKSQQMEAESQVQGQVPQQVPQQVAKTNGVVASVPLVSPKQRPTQSIAIDVPLKFQNFYLGDVHVLINGAGGLLVKVSTLAPPLRKIMKPEVVSRLTTANGTVDAARTSPGSNEIAVLKGMPPTPSLGREPVLAALSVAKDAAANAAPGFDPQKIRAENADASYLPIDELKRRGLDLAYDPQSSELSVTASIDQKLDGNLSLGGLKEGQVSANAKPPAFFSAYLNTRASLAYITHSISGDRGAEKPAFDFDGAMRVGAVVLENEAAITPQNLGPGSLAGGAYDLTRRGTRFVYDRPDDFIRYKAGDLTPGYMAFQTAPDLLGLSAERVHSHFRPGQNIRPTGQHTFRLERPSNVDILIDGVIFRRLRLDAGNYNINDLPLKPGATKIALAIEEDTGARRTLEFTNFGGQDLLAPGVNEWHIASGVQSLRGINRIGISPPFAGVSYYGPEYSFSEPIATGFYRTGLTPSLTGGVHAQATRHVAMGGGGLATETAYGYVSLDLAASLSNRHSSLDGSGPLYGNGDGFRKPDAAGVAARAAYERLNIRDDSGRSQSFRVSGEYQSAGFATVNSFYTPRDYAVSLNMLYARELSDDLSASLSGSLFLLRDELFSPQRWDIDLTLSQRFSSEFSGSVSVGYGEGGSGLLNLGSCACDNNGEFSGVRAFLRISYRADASSSVALSHDTRTASSRATYTEHTGSGLGSWNAIIDAAHDGKRKSGDINGSFDYTGNRGEVSVSHATRLNGLAANGFDPKSTSERTSLRVESGIATADGGWSFGRPIRNSFAIVETHETLGDRELILGTSEAEIGRSDRFAAALLPDISPYSQRRVPIDVDALPLGYDLGAGSFDFHGPYKSGYRVEAGSAYTVTAVGTLINQNGQPVALLEGTAREAGGKDPREVSFFTNRAGRFGAQGLAPGKWLVEMPVEPQPLRYAFEIPLGNAGLVTLGHLKPSD